MILVEVLALLGLAGLLLLLIPGCASDSKRQAWQDCGGTHHEVCWDDVDPLACEYEFYKVCINDVDE